MNSNIKYSDIEFCTNLLFNAIYGANDNCYQIQTIDRKNIKMEDLRKPLDYDYSDIFKGKIKYLGYYNNRIHYKVTQHFHPYEISIGVNKLNINDVNRPELQNMAFLLMCSEIVFNEKFLNFTLPLMCFDITKTELTRLINDSNLDKLLANAQTDKFYVIVTEHFLSTQTLKEYLDENIESITPEKLKKILFEIFVIIAKLNERFNNFNHNNINLHSLKICMLNKPVNRKYKINGILMEIPDVDFILKIDDFDKAISTDYNFDETKDILYNPYVDINVVMNHMYTFILKHNKMNTELEEFFNDIIPEKYRPKLDIEKFNQTSDITITSEVILKKNKFFKNFIKMEVSVTPRNIEKMNIDNLQQKDEGILYIDYNKKNKKSHKYYSMYKGVRQIVVPGLRKNSKRDMSASEGSLFFKDEVTERSESHKKDETTTSTETTVRDTMNTLNPNVTSSSSSSESETTPKNKKDSSSSSSSSSEMETATKGMTEMSADSKAIMRALAQNTDSRSEMSRSKTSKKNKKSSKKGKRHAKEESSSSLSSSVSSMRVSEGGMGIAANLSAKNKEKLKNLPSNYFDLAPEGLVQQMMNQQYEGGMEQGQVSGTENPMAGLLGQPGMMQPGMMQPGMMQPGMMQPGMMPPGMQGMMPQGMPPGMPGMPPGMPGMPPGMPGMMPQGMMQAQEGLGANIPLNKVDSNMNSFLNGNMAGGSKGGKQQFKLNFF